MNGGNNMTTTIVVDIIAITNAKMRACLSENDRLISILEDEAISYEDKLIASNEVIINIEKFRSLFNQKSELIIELADLKYAADKAAIERWYEKKKKELLGE